MFRRSSGYRAALGIAFALCLCPPALFADTIQIKDSAADQQKGMIVSFADGTICCRDRRGFPPQEPVTRRHGNRLHRVDLHSAIANQLTANRRPGSIVPVSTKTWPQVVTSERTPPGITSNSPQGPANGSPGSSTRSTEPVVKLLPEPRHRPHLVTAARRSLSRLASKGWPTTANAWTNSGFVVKCGQRIRVTGTGSVSLGHGTTSIPSGLSDLDDNQKLKGRADRRVDSRYR